MKALTKIREIQLFVVVQLKTPSLSQFYDFFVICFILNQFKVPETTRPVRSENLVDVLNKYCALSTE